MEGRDDEFEDGIYDLFPTGEDEGIRPELGYNKWVRINDAKWFTDEALEDAVIQQFVKAPFSVSFAQFKSSHREAEYFIHKPRRAMTGGVKKIGSDEQAIEGTVDRFPEGDPRIPTLVINHERSLAKRITRSIVIADDSTAGQIIHKEPEP
jgi:hypothetical protein